MPAGLSFLFCILIETELTTESSHYDYFVLRIVLGILVGVIYLTSIIECLQSGGITPTRASYLSSASICGYLTIALVFLLSQTQISIELCCVSLTLLYSLIALNLSHSTWIFGGGGGSKLDEQWQWHLQRRQGLNAVAAATTETVVDGMRPPNARAFDAFDASFHLIVGKQTRPLIYLAGAKLLAIFCYFLPFISIASRITIHANILFTDVDYANKYNENDSTLGNADDDVINSSSKIFTDLMVLLLTRIALGSLAISFVRHNVNCLSIVYMMPASIGLAIMLLIPIFDLPSHLKTVQTIAFSIVMIIYVAFSLIVDIIGHRAALYVDEMEMSHSHATAALKVISLTFATFTEHLIDICIVVVYLNDWISAKLIATSFAIIFLTMVFSLTSANASERKQNNANLITVKYQIL